MSAGIVASADIGQTNAGLRDAAVDLHHVKEEEGKEEGTVQDHHPGEITKDQTEHPVIVENILNVEIVVTFKAEMVGADAVEAQGDLAAAAEGRMTGEEMMVVQSSCVKVCALTAEKKATSAITVPNTADHEKGKTEEAALIEEEKAEVEVKVEITDQEAAVTEAAEVAETTILHKDQEADHLGLHIKVATMGIEVTEEVMPAENTTVITEDKEITDKREPRKKEEMAGDTANRDPDRPEETEISIEGNCNETEYYD